VRKDRVALDRRFEIVDIDGKDIPLKVYFNDNLNVKRGKVEFDFIKSISIEDGKLHRDRFSNKIKD